MGKSKMSDSELVFSVQVQNVETSWGDNGCSIDNVSLKKVLSKFAFNLEIYVKTLAVLGNVCAIDRFNLDGSIWVEIRTIPSNKGLGAVEGEIESARKSVRHSMMLHRDLLLACADGSMQHIPVTENCVAVEALSKCLTSVVELEVEFDFKDAGMESIKTTMPIAGMVVSCHTEDIASITGSVRQFDDLQERFVLYAVEGLYGSVQLNVRDAAQRKALILAQLERRQVEVKYSPYQKKIRPDQNLREGLLVEIGRIGPSQLEI